MPHSRSQLWLAASALLFAAGSSVLLWDDVFEASTGINPFVVGVNCMALGATIWFYRLGLTASLTPGPMFVSASVLLGVGLASFVLSQKNATLGFRDWGAMLVLFGIVGVAYALAATRPHAQSAIALGEKTALVGFLITAFVCSVLFSWLQSFDWLAKVRDHGARKMVPVIVIALTVQWIVVGILNRRERTPDVNVLEDERDIDIRRRAATIAFITLQMLLILGVALLWVFPPKWSGTSWTSPIATVHVLIGALLITQLVRHASTIWLYRRGRA